MSLESQKIDESEKRGPSLRIFGKGLDSSEIEQTVLERVEKRKALEPEEVDRVRSLSFTPVPTATGFDPGRITEQFESSVSPPDFNNPKYRYLPRFFRKIAYRIFPMFSVLYEKLSENKVQAFFDLVHETIAINHRHRRLREEFHLLLEDNLRLRGALESRMDSSGETGQTAQKRRRTTTEEWLDPYFSGPRFAGLLSHDVMKKNASVFVLDDAVVSFAGHLKRKGIQGVRASSLAMDHILDSPDTESFAVEPVSADAALGRLEDRSVDAIIHTDIENITGVPEHFLQLASRKLRPDGLLFLSRPESPVSSAFQRKSQYSIDPTVLQRSVEELGLRTEKIVTDPENSSFFSLFLRAPKSNGPSELDSGY